VAGSAIGAGEVGSALGQKLGVTGGTTARRAALIRNVLLASIFECGLVVLCRSVLNNWYVTKTDLQL
jgi:hypothetical protein